ncbi:MAG: CRISPR-associated endonuclease Cas2 [candidate division Zixibacteria bacterium HGW-Zixibacteria-1]|nr:MAG: CRISPR-associated endonuclease Cas2 [candidate division Zixibacteria bacterium HGW-Zixibacteria-1]
MHYIVTYDIADNKTRLKTSKILDDYGDRVQESVFELPNLDVKIWNKCLNRLEKQVILGDGDSIRIYILCEGCRQRTIVLGIGVKPFDDPDVIVI